MYKKVITLLFFLFLLTIGFQPSLSAQENSPGATIDGKRRADLTTKVDDGPKPFLNSKAVKEFDRFAGNCLDNYGDPIQGVTVKVFGINREEGTVIPVASAETGEDGTFALDDLQSTFATDKFKRYFIAVLTKDGLATRFSSSWKWKESNEMSMKPRSMVRGVVRNELGEPVPNARVSFYNSLKKVLPDIHADTTGVDGRFEINDFHEVNSVPFRDRDGEIRGSRKVPLTVDHPDYGKVSLMIDRTPNLFEIKVTRGAKFVGLIVDEDDKPAAGCEVSMQGHNGHAGIWLTTTTDDSGSFEFTKVPSIPANLFFSSQDLVGESIVLTGEPGSDTDLGKLRLQKPIIIRGVVIDDETGEPFNGREQSEGWANNIGWHGPERPKTSSGVSTTPINADGTFECRFLPGRNFPYVASGYLETIGSPYPDGVEIEAGTDLKLEFRIRVRNPNDPTDR